MGYKLQAVFKVAELCPKRRPRTSSDQDMVISDLVSVSSSLMSTISSR
jgi:hypothetical protein